MNTISKEQEILFIQSVLNIHGATKEMCRLENVDSFFKCSEEGKLGILATCINDVANIVPDDDYAQFIVAGIITFLGMRNKSTEKFEVLETVPVLLELLENNMVKARNDFDGEAYITHMCMIAETKRKRCDVWGQVSHYYHVGNEILANN